MRIWSTTLPPPLIDPLAEIGRQLALGGELGAELDVAIGLLADLPPGQISRVDHEIAIAADLDPRRRPAPAAGSLISHPTDAERLLRTPGLERLFLFHRDGRLREAALRRITGGLPGPFIFAAVVWRLNDWVAPVRTAAARCATRSFPATGAKIVAEAVTALLVQQSSWGRWSDERGIFYDTLGRVDVAEHLSNFVIGEATGSMTSILLQAIRVPAFDPHLDRMSTDAVQPSVRAVALNALINGKAQWPCGWAWQWIDKPTGFAEGSSHLTTGQSPRRSPRQN